MTAAPSQALRTRLQHLGDPALRTRRLAFALPNLSRVPEVVRLLGEPSVARWTLHVPFPYAASDARAWVRRATAARREGREVMFQLVRRSDGCLVGGAGLHHLDAENARGEIGYWIGRPFRHHGYAREAARALTSFGGRSLGLHRIEARIFPGNRASGLVLRSIGFRREGRLRQSVVKNGRFRDEIVYARFPRGRSFLRPHRASVPALRARAGRSPRSSIRRLAAKVPARVRSWRPTA